MEALSLDNFYMGEEKKKQKSTSIAAVIDSKLTSPLKKPAVPVVSGAVVGSSNDNKAPLCFACDELADENVPLQKCNRCVNIFHTMCMLMRPVEEEGDVEGILLCKLCYDKEFPDLGSPTPGHD